jgi:predicted ATPase/uncharacterized protein (DUF2267 family)
MSTGLEVFDTTLQHTNLWLKELMEHLGIDRRHAYKVLGATLHAVRDRIGPENAVHLGAQLPMLIRGFYYEGWHLAGTPIKLRHKEDFLDYVSGDVFRGLGVEPERAVRAALELTAAVAALGEEVGLDELRARAGVLTGEAAVTVGATNQSMVAGDLVNTASRIQSAAPPGGVLVGEATKHVTDSAIVYEDAGSHEVKGKAEAIQLFRALRVVGLVGGSMRSREIEPPFTGRDTELRHIKELFHTSSGERRAHLVSVAGVGGIGKSRLSWEFEKYIDGLAANTWWHKGRCLAYGDGVAFWALAEMVRGRAGILEDEDSADALAKLRATLDLYLPDPEERRFVEPRLSQLLGLEARGSGDQENLFSAWRLFFERVADSQPTILVFEDIHWADGALLDFIEYLLEWSRDHPIFILTLTRPELLERRPTWGAARRSFTSLFLDPLPQSAVETLLDGAVHGLPDELRTQVIERAEGIPFYAVETVRMLLDQGLLVKDNGAYRPTGPIQTLEVPATLQALIAARLDGLAVEERHVLQDAAVLGRTFSLAGLTAMTGTGGPDLKATLDALVRKEMLTIRDDPLSPERGQYAFLQDLVRRVAYDMLSKKDRRTRHLAAANYLAQLGGADDDDVIEVIAAHRYDAYLSNPDASDAEERTVTGAALERAGDRADSLGANLPAQRHYEHAAALAEDPIRRAELLERAGTMAGGGTRPEEAAALYAEAEQLFTSAGATHPAARVSARAAEALWDLGRMGDGLASMDRAYSVLASDPPDADLATLAAQIGRFSFFAGELDQSLLRIEDALAMSESLGLPEVLSQALNTKALMLLSRDRRQEATALMRYALETALEADKPSAALRAYNNLTDVLMQADRYAEAAENVDEGLQLARRVGNRYWEQILLGHVFPLYALGEWDEVLRRMGELRGLDESLHARSSFTQGYLAFGSRIYIARGDVAAAQRLLETFAEFRESADAQEQLEFAAAEAVVLSAGGDHANARRTTETVMEHIVEFGWVDARIKESVVLNIESSIALADLSAAEAFLDQVDVRARAQRMRFLLPQVQRLRANILSRADPDAAAVMRDDAITGFRGIANPFWLAATLLEQAEELGRLERTDEAAPLLDESRSIFTNLGATTWLVRVDTASPRLAVTA